MIGTIRTWWQNPRRRREALTVTSGLLIILALVAGYLLRQQPWRDALMALAALIAGADIALRAWNSLRHRVRLRPDAGQRHSGPDLRLEQPAPPPRQH